MASTRGTHWLLDLTENAYPILDEHVLAVKLRMYQDELPGPETTTVIKVVNQILDAIKAAEKNLITTSDQQHAEIVVFISVFNRRLLQITCVSMGVRDMVIPATTTLIRLQSLEASFQRETGHSRVPHYRRRQPFNDSDYDDGDPREDRSRFSWHKRTGDRTLAVITHLLSLNPVTDDSLINFNATLLWVPTCVTSAEQSESEPQNEPTECDGGNVATMLEGRDPLAAFKLWFVRVPEEDLWKYALFTMGLLTDGSSQIDGAQISLSRARAIAGYRHIRGNRPQFSEYPTLTDLSGDQAIQALTYDSTMPLYVDSRTGEVILSLPEAEESHKLVQSGLQSFLKIDTPSKDNLNLSELTPLEQACLIVLRSVTSPEDPWITVTEIHRQIPQYVNDICSADDTVTNCSMVIRALNRLLKNYYAPLLDVQREPDAAFDKCALWTMTAPNGPSLDALTEVLDKWYTETELQVTLRDPDYLGMGARKLMNWNAYFTAVYKHSNAAEVFAEMITLCTFELLYDRMEKVISESSTDRHTFNDHDWIDPSTKLADEAISIYALVDWMQTHHGITFNLPTDDQVLHDDIMSVLPTMSELFTHEPLVFRVRYLNLPNRNKLKQLQFTFSITTQVARQRKDYLSSASEADKCLFTYIGALQASRRTTTIPRLLAILRKLVKVKPGHCWRDELFDLLKQSESWISQAQLQTCLQTLLKDKVIEDKYTDGIQTFGLTGKYV